MDFIDQGQSDKLKSSLYTQDIQVQVIECLLKELKLKKVSVVGISYGGEVAIQFAIKHPNLVDRLVLFNTTPYTSPWLAEIGYKWNSIGKTRDGQTYYQATIPAIYSPSFYEQKIRVDEKKRTKLTSSIFKSRVLRSNGKINQ